MQLSRHDGLLGPQDLSWRQIYDYVLSLTPSHGPLPPPYDDLAFLERTCRAFVAECQLWGWRTSGYTGQIMHETGVLRYPGDVDPGQLNYGGIGATGNGVKGHSFPTPEHGARVNSEHLAVYLWGTRDRWPIQLDVYVDPRYQNVLSAGWGATVTTWAGLAGKWPENIGSYGPGIERHGNGMLSMPKGDTGGSPILLKVAIAAGHHNAQGGNDVEQEIVAELTERMFYHLSRQPNIDVRSLTPDGPDADDLPGDGYVNERIYAMWTNALSNWARQGWVPDLTIEQHTQGVTNTSVRGWFGIYPDWTNDTDVDVRDELIPKVRARIQQHTPLPIWSDGVMSERETAVGSAGDRLGYFLATAYLKADVERVLFESGAHSSPEDRKLLQTPEIADKIAEAQVMGICDYYGLTYVPPHAAPPGELPTTSRGNQVERYFPETDAGILGAFKGRWELLEQHGLVYPHVGLPRSDEFQVNPDNQPFYDMLGHRTFQVFERCCFAWNADKEGTVWNVESLFGHAYELVVMAANRQGVYVHGE